MNNRGLLIHLPGLTKILVISILALFGITPAIADEVLITNGDRLTGEVVRHDTEKLRLKTSYAGTLEISWDEVSEVVLSEPVIVLLKDESTLEVSAYSRMGESFELQLQQGASPVTLAASEINVIKPEAWELGQGHQFTGRVNLAWESDKGNSEETDFDLDFELNYRWRKNHLLSYGEIEYDTTRGFRSSDNWTWFSNLDHSFEGKWYYAGALMLKKDRFADLQLRTLVGPGLGYRFHQSKALNLRTEVGFYYLKDNFYEQRDEKFWGPAWFIDYDQQVWKRRLQIYHRQMGFVAVNGSDKFLWRSWTGVRMPLIAGLLGSIEYEIDYDSEPAIEAETTDQKFNLKLGYKW